MHVVPIVVFLLVGVASWLDAYSASTSMRMVIWGGYWSIVVTMFAFAAWSLKRSGKPLGLFSVNAAVAVAVALAVMIYIQPGLRRSVQESIDAANELEREVQEIRQRNADRASQR